jgi:hypothetical protein
MHRQPPVMTHTSMWAMRRETIAICRSSTPPRSVAVPICKACAPGSGSHVGFGLCSLQD